MFTIIITAVLSSIFTSLTFLFIFHKIIQPYLTLQLANIKQEAELTIAFATPQISKEIASAIEDKVTELRPEIEQQVKQELDLVIADFLPQLSKEVARGVDNSFKKFIPTLVGAAAAMPADTLIKTSSTLLNTGLNILKGVSTETKR
jgi:hypothetical protein